MSESIAVAIIEHGNIWTLDVNKRMESLYEPLQFANSATLNDVVQIEKSIRYGTHPRHRMEVLRI